jgi:hypothetical protein
MAKNTAPTPDDVYQQLRRIIGEHDYHAVLDVLRAALACPACGGTSRVCPSCAGKVGGRRLTKAKLRQLKHAAKRPRPGARRKPEPRA